MTKSSDDDDFSDNEIDDEAHKKLLKNVSHLGKFQYVEKSTRTEPTTKISEFDLVKSAAGSSSAKISLKDLTKGLDARSSQVQVQKKLKKIVENSGTLSKPLEKPEAQKIRRKVGFSKTKEELSRWDAIVTRNRASDNLKFPLLKHNPDDKKKKNKNYDDLVDGFHLKSELQLEMEKLKPKVEIFNLEDEDDKQFPLSLQEIMEKRKEMAKFRAQQSYMEAKAKRQGKIKSKKYHRVQRREKMKQQLKEFEQLQKTNPEEALKKLEEIERARAEERASLRHKSTGKWAKSKLIRAKYDKETRQVLAQQLSMSKELTQKINVNDSSDSENEAQNDESKNKAKTKVANNSDNPWLNSSVKTSQEITDFLSGYRKYWDEKNKSEDNNKTTKENGIDKIVDVDSDEDSDVSVDTSKVALIKENGIDKHDEVIETNDGVANIKPVKVNVIPKKIAEPQQEIVKAKAKPNELVVIDDSVMTNGDMKKQKKKGTGKKESNEENVLCVNKEKEQESNVANEHKELKNKKKRKKRKLNIEIQKEDTTEQKKIKLNEDASKPMKNVKNITKPTQSLATKLENRKNNTKKKQKASGFTVEENVNKKQLTLTKSMDLETIFQKMDEKINAQLMQRVTKLKQSIGSKKPKNSKQKLKKKDKKNCNKKQPSNTTSTSSIDLHFPKQATRPEIDEELITANDIEDESDPKKNQLDKLAKLLRNEEEEENEDAESGEEDANKNRNKIISKDSNIDPNKFIKMKSATILNTELPDMVNVDDENNDFSDEDEGKSQREMISQAFQDDDVLDEFSKDKKRAINKDKVAPVDLSLPGWGTWGGKNIKMSKRKRKRFIVKFPQKEKRRDQNKGELILNEKAQKKIKEHQVSELPFPFKTVKDYEASIRAPIGNTWVAETAHRRLIRPTVRTKMGTIIEPMDKSELLNMKKRKGVVKF